MIARIWGGKVPLKHEADFQLHLLETGVRGYRQQSGCIEVKLFRHNVDGWASFLLISVWTSMDAICAYTGPAYERAVLYKGDESFGLVPDTTATHYEVLNLDRVVSGEHP
jgi:quinol monooxygenase YgiN